MRDHSKKRPILVRWPKPTVNLLGVSPAGLARAHANGRGRSHAGLGRALRLGRVQSGGGQ